MCNHPSGRVDSWIGTIADSADVFHSQEALPPTVIEDDLRGAVIDAARRCMLRIGFEKTTMADVARLAGVSRGSIYNHFHDRDQLVGAVTELGNRLLMADLELAMAGDESLEHAIGRTAVVIERWRAASRQRRWGGLFEEPAAAVLLTSQSAELVHQIASILRPHIEAATASGDVRRDLNVDQAAEWLTRILLSLVSNPAASFDEDNEPSVIAFITSFCVRGLR